MKIAGLDVATTTGWCIAEGQKYATGKFHPGKKLDDGQVYHKFRSWLWTFLIHNGIERVAIEAPLMTNVTETHMRTDKEFFGAREKRNAINQKTIVRLNVLNGIAQEVCTALNIPFWVVHQATWRKAFIGKKPQGEDWKDAAVRICQTTGIDIGSKDAAEAAGVAFWLQLHLKQERIQGGDGPLFAGAAA